MSYFYDACFSRKVDIIKDWLRADNYYDDTILTRVVTKTGASGVYNRNVTTSHTDTLVSGLVTYRPEYVSFDEDVETINADAQFTCKASDKTTILNADELWLNYTLSGSSVTAGTMYRVKSDMPTLYDVDHIINLTIAGKNSG